MYEYHAEENSDYTITCYFCGNNFRTKGDLMVHRKKAHAEKVRLCRFYEKGCCDRGDSDCWFSHDKTAKKTPETYSCSICENIFGTRSEFMHHRKKEHSETVPKCKDEYGTCQFGITKCWFKHDEHRTINTHENTENLIENNQDVIE